MANVGRAAWALSLVTDPCRAEELAASLAQEGGRSALIFWPPVAWTALLLTVKQALAAPLAMLAAFLATSLLVFPLSYGFTTIPFWLIHRPYDESPLSSIWFREAAQICASHGAVWGWQNVVGPFLIGLLAATVARGREVPACISILVLEQAPHAASLAWHGQFGPHALAAPLLHAVPAYAVATFAAAIVRIWRLNAVRNERRALLRQASNPDPH